MSSESFFLEARRSFHAALLKKTLTISEGVASNADKSSKTSREIAEGIYKRLITEDLAEGVRLAGQMAGSEFEQICAEYVKKTFPKLSHLRPGEWAISVPSRGKLAIANYQQYTHLNYLASAAQKDRELAAALGGDYTVSPDVIIVRNPEVDDVINSQELLIGEDVTRLASLRKKNQEIPILHASISCKWTIRSDRAQNARSEALNLIRNRKGHLPHVVVVTGEPLPARIASLALGTGDIDCVYHFALYELLDAVDAQKKEESQEILRTMVEGKRLKDITDLPLDLAI